MSTKQGGDLSRAAQQFVRDVVTKDLKQKISESALRDAAAKVVKVIPTATEQAKPRSRG